ncbi:MAG: hypothetical protein L3J35_08085 [Bacteroidales bacterium]|nr:hypothetical protein [Bacteroidales bacterium]
MQFEKGYIYHIYNQGNNRRKIFFNRENYLYFLRKIKTHITPYADILAWCLMPNHFHLMVYVREVEVSANIWSATQSCAPNRTPNSNKKISINHSLGIILSSYTKAINKQEKISGSLFRGKTKAECINCPNGIEPSFITKNGITNINIQHPEKQYPKICFDYIHKNPTKAKLVKQDIEWEFSSAADYYGDRKGKLINKLLAVEYGFISENN